jgi:hypothetical protein
MMSLSFLLITGCSEDKSTNPAAVNPLTGIWQGMYSYDQYTADSVIIVFDKNNNVEVEVYMLSANNDIMLQGIGGYDKINDQLLKIHLDTVWIEGEVDTISGYDLDTTIYWLNENVLELSVQAESWLQLAGPENQLINSTYYYREYNSQYHLFLHYRYSFIENFAELSFESSESFQIPTYWEESIVLDCTINDKTINFISTEYELEYTIAYAFTLDKLFVGSDILVLTRK